jgi:hypothetical protein
VHDERPERRGGDDRGRPASRRPDEGHLAEEVAGAQGSDQRPLTCYFDGPALDDVELVAGRAFGDDALTFIGRPLFHPGRDPLALGVRQVREEGKRA